MKESPVQSDSLNSEATFSFFGESRKSLSRAVIIFYVFSKLLVQTYIYPSTQKYLTFPGGVFSDFSDPRFAPSLFSSLYVFYDCAQNSVYTAFYPLRGHLLLRVTNDCFHRFFFIYFYPAAVKDTLEYIRQVA